MFWCGTNRLLCVIITCRLVTRTVRHTKVDDAPSTTVKVFFMHCMSFNYQLCYRPTADQLMNHSALHKVCRVVYLSSTSMLIECATLSDLGSKECQWNVAQLPRLHLGSNWCQIDCGLINACMIHMLDFIFGHENHSDEKHFAMSWKRLYKN